MVTSGVLPANGTVREWLLVYCSRLREVAAGRVGELSEERARLARAQAENVEMKNAVLRREYAPVTLLEEALGRVSRQMAGILEALPGNLRRRSPLLTAEDIKLVELEIARVRNLAATVTLEDATTDAAEAADTDHGEDTATEPA